MERININQLEEYVFDSERTKNVPILYVMQTLFAVEDFLESEDCNVSTIPTVSAVPANADDAYWEWLCTEYVTESQRHGRGEGISNASEFCNSAVRC